MNYSLFLFFVFLKIFLQFHSFYGQLRYKFTEQHTEEQQDTVAIADKVLAIVSNILDSAQKVSASKDSVTLSLIDQTKEVILEEPLQEQVEVDVITKDNANIEESGTVVRAIVNG